MRLNRMQRNITVEDVCYAVEPRATASELLGVQGTTCSIIVDRSTTGISHPYSEFMHDCPNSVKVYEHT